MPGTLAAQTPPRRIVSVNLCTDQYVLALADRAQIAGLTRNAADPDMSAGAKAARGLPQLGSSAEALLAVHPDLVLGMPVPAGGALEALGALHYRKLDLAIPPVSRISWPKRGKWPRPPATRRAARR
jgi:iron complex transport system substrate-binding protein